MQNDNFEKQRMLIEGDNVNITESNVLKELIQILINLILSFVFIYYSMFFISGIIINLMPIEKQVVIENFLSKMIENEEFKTLDIEEKAKIDDIKNKIKKIDKKFPDTSNLDVKIFKEKQLNAYCAPNGNIYITDALYNKIKDDEEMLFFVIAHEMAHYKNKDHIMNLRKNIASSAVIIVATIAGSNLSDFSKLVETTIKLTDLKYSRKSEAKADKYAGIMLLKNYGNIEGAVNALELFSRYQYDDIPDVLSTHPDTFKRIKNLKALKYDNLR